MKEMPRAGAARLPIAVNDVGQAGPILELGQPRYHLRTTHTQPLPVPRPEAEKKLSKSPLWLKF